MRRWKKVREGWWRKKKRERERFMSDMVIFISRGKKARFHAVGAFIPFSDDKGTESENRKYGEREREKEIRRRAKTLKLWTCFSKEPYVEMQTIGMLVLTSRCRLTRRLWILLIFY